MITSDARGARERRDTHPAKRSRLLGNLKAPDEVIIDECERNYKHTRKMVDTAM